MKKITPGNTNIMRFLTTTFILVSLALNLTAQDCQLVAMHIDIPEGISKHHFPMQTMPVTAAEDHFTYLAEWNQGDLAIRIRFSKDGEQWTKWEVLKRDFRTPEIAASPLNMAENNYEYLEWAVYNKSGIESHLTLNFYHPTSQTIYADLNDGFPMEISTVGCPQPTIIPTTSSTPVVTTNSDNK
jgi:hypothetical protein